MGKINLILIDKIFDYGFAIGLACMFVYCFGLNITGNLIAFIVSIMYLGFVIILIFKKIIEEGFIHSLINK